MAVYWEISGPLSAEAAKPFKVTGRWLSSEDSPGDTLTIEIEPRGYSEMANRKYTMDLAMVLDRVERITGIMHSPEVEDVLWRSLYRDVLIAIASEKCGDPMACASAALRPGTIVDEAGT